MELTLELVYQTTGDTTTADPPPDVTALLDDTDLKNRIANNVIDGENAAWPLVWRVQGGEQEGTLLGLYRDGYDAEDPTVAFIWPRSDGVYGTVPGMTWQVAAENPIAIVAQEHVWREEALRLMIVPDAWFALPLAYRDGDEDEDYEEPDPFATTLSHHFR